MSKTFFIDTTRCTACRGCQVACKEWQGFAPNKTTQVGWGSHQNPPDLNPLNYKVVRFAEHKINGRVVWNFFPDQCRHCIDPACKYPADEYKKGAVIVDEATGAVLYTDACKSLPKEIFVQMKDYCPFDVPRRDEETGVINKCDMCIERVKARLVPMCVRACPTGAMNFGDREAMMELANRRLGVVKAEYADAQLLYAEELNVVYLVNYKPELYYKTVAAAPKSVGFSRKDALARFFEPLKNLTKV
jgi:formate dehydrogenase iron-sulfur subunit